jgi:poly [ADP-ribose] polymerase 7/11/12/13
MQGDGGVEVLLDFMKRMQEKGTPADVVVCGSKGGAYMIELWSRLPSDTLTLHGWAGFSMMVNVHPKCTCLPKGITIVLTHGSRDATFPRKRDELQELVKTGSPNKCMLYYVPDSGKLRNGVYIREGDGHTQQSLVKNDCLPRLLDAAMSGVPEMHVLHTWQHFLSQDRQKAETALGLGPPGSLRRYWKSKDKEGLDSSKLFEVDKASEEYKNIEKIFKAEPVTKAHYHAVRGWHNDVEILKIDRVENGDQSEASSMRYESARRNMKDQLDGTGESFTQGVHTRWLFHGTAAIDAIVQDPQNGFNEIMSGSAVGNLWGQGIYFARDAAYSVDYSRVNKDGSKSMLLCHVTTGMCTVGDPEMRICPKRTGHHKFNSTVDSLSNPEIFVLQKSEGALPAYVITYVFP